MNVKELFELLPKVLPNYENRQQQTDLAQSIEYAIKANKLGVFEAGTGTGKSLAALVPAVLSHKKVVVSTKTISLQEQYLHKDLPVLSAALPFEFKSALLKGRGNYLSLRRWEETLLEREVDNRLIDWVAQTETGDMSELEFVPSWDIWQEMNSDHDDCLRNKCPRFEQCFYFDAKRMADQADVLVVNHALLMMDAAFGYGILPKYEVLIVDEAHHLRDIATDVFSVSISNRRIKALGARAIKQVLAPMVLIHDIEAEAIEFFQDLISRHITSKVRLTEPVESASELAAKLHLFQTWLEEQTFEHLLDVNQAQERAKLKAKALLSTIAGFLRCLDLIIAPDPNWVVWLNTSGLSNPQTEIVAAPLDVSGYISESLLSRAGLESTIFMSATLATVGEDPFGFFKKSIGIEKNVVQEIVASPFDYAKQALLYLPSHLPEPNHGGFLEHAAKEIEKVLHISEGRAFVLFTSRAALLSTYEMIASYLPYECRRQGEVPRNKLIEWFRSTPNAVLFGTASFWEGVSVDGEQLSCVIIDRIPFQSPDDPIYEARCEAIKQDENGDWFNDLALPQATMRLKQGVGRLIRTRSDRGIVAILDTRLTAKKYGRKILEFLPPMNIINSLSEVDSLSQVFETNLS